MSFGALLTKMTPEIQQDAQENLGLPLVGHGLRGAVAADGRHDVFVAGVAGKGFIESGRAVSVAAFGNHDDDAARLARAFGGGHAFDGLIDVLVERIAAVCRDDDIRRLGLAAAQLADEAHAGLVRRVQIAAERADDFFFGVEHDIEDKFQSGFLRALTHVHMDGVVIEQAGFAHRDCRCWQRSG